MTLVVIIILAAALVALGAEHLRHRRRGSNQRLRTGARRILFPYVADALSLQALDAALRLASADDATLVPVFLARVSLHLPIDTPLPRQSARAIALQEAIEQRAAAYGIPVDARIERGRTYRHALRHTIANERFDRIVIAAAAHESAGCNPEDVAWLLANAPAEIVVLRPGQDEHLELPAPKPQRVRPRRTRDPAVESRIAARRPARALQ